MSVNYENRLPTENRDASRRNELSTRCREFSRRMMQDHPLATTLGVFGVGLGVGTMIGAVLADQRPSHTRQAEVLGRRVMGAVKDILPAGVRSYLS